MVGAALSRFVVGAAEHQMYPALAIIKLADYYERILRRSRAHITINYDYYNKSSQVTKIQGVSPEISDLFRA